MPFANLRRFELTLSVLVHCIVGAGLLVASTLVVLFSLAIVKFSREDAEVARQWQPVTARILDKRLAVSSEERFAKHPARAPFSQGYSPEFQMEYSFDGSTRTCWGYRRLPSFAREEEARAILARFEAGSEYPAWVNPADPTQAVLTTERSGIGYLLIVPALGLVLVTTAGWLLFRSFFGKRKTADVELAAE